MMRTGRINTMTKRIISISLATLMMAGTANIGTLEVFAENKTAYSSGGSSSVTWSESTLSWNTILNVDARVTLSASTDNNLTLDKYSPDNIGVITYGMDLDIRNNATGTLGSITTVKNSENQRGSTISVASGANVGANTLTIVSDAKLDNSSTFASTTINNSGTIAVQSSGVLNAGTITNNGALTNNGTLNISTGYSGSGTLTNTNSADISCSTSLSKGTNTGTITTSNDLTINKGFNNASGKIIVADGGSLTFSGFNSTDNMGTVIVTSNSALLSSDGGSFKLYDDNEIPVTISGSFTDKTRSELLNSAPTVTISVTDKNGNPITTVYKGTIAKVSSTVTYNDNGTPVTVKGEDVGLTYSIRPTTSVDYTPWTPVDSGTGSLEDQIENRKYVIEATVPALDGKFWRSGSGTSSYITVKYLPYNADTMPVTISGTQGRNGWYISNLTLQAPDGYLLCSGSAATPEDSGQYLSSVEFSQENCQDPYHMLFQIKRKSDGAYTNYLYPTNLFPDFDFLSVKIDKIDPVVINANVDSMDFALTSGANITGRTLTFTAADENLQTLTVDGVSYDVERNESELTHITDGGVEKNAFTKEITAVPGKPAHTIVVTDKAGRETKLNFDFTYSRDNSTAALSVDDVTYGETPVPVLTSNSDGVEQAIYEYKEENENTYSETVPTQAGTYTVRATIPATNRYKEITAECTFQILQAELTPTITVEDTYAKTDYEPTIAGIPADLYGVTIKYRSEDETEDAFTTAKPTVPGTYVARVTVDNNRNYTATSAECTFRILQIEPKIKVTMNDAYVGTEYAPTITGVPEESDDVTILYRAADKKDDAFTATKPTTPGKYVVRATSAESCNYKSACAETTFSISYLPIPAVTYEVSAKKGQNDYYVSTVWLVAPEGYLLGEPGGEFAKRLLYTEDLKIFRLRRTEDGALTNLIMIDEAFKVDIKAPVAGNAVDEKGKVITLKDGLNLFADKLEFTIEDEDLANVTVNGDAVEIVDNKAKIVLEANGKTKNFEIRTEDKAGNVNTMNITLKAGWLEYREIPYGVLILLEQGESYSLLYGKWVVSGDTTIYNGGQTIYVRTEGDYTFNPVEQ